MFYYLCKRCSHMTKQKIEMQRHLNKNKKCEIKDPNNKYSPNELLNMSLIKHEIIRKNDDKDDENIDYIDNNIYEFINNSIVNSNVNINNTNINEKENFCNKCNKYFYSKSNLKKHLNKNICDKKEGINNIQNIGVQNNIINNNQVINININYVKGFDEEWDVSQIDNSMKGEILLSDSKFSKTLENILENDVNLNVILKDNDIGIVYKNQKNKYEPMSKQEIIELSMNKIYKHLKDFYEEIIKNNINNFNEDALKKELIELEKKYGRFFRLDEAKNIVKNSFTNIYNNKKDEAENKYFELLEDNDIKKMSY